MSLRDDSTVDEMKERCQAQECTGRRLCSPKVAGRVMKVEKKRFPSTMSTVDRPSDAVIFSQIQMDMRQLGRQALYQIYDLCYEQMPKTRFDVLIQLSFTS
jgi:hypothetical protein